MNDTTPRALAAPPPEPRNTGPGWEPHNQTVKLPRSVTHPRPSGMRSK